VIAFIFKSLKCVADKFIHGLVDENYSYQSGKSEVAKSDSKSIHGFLVDTALNVF